MWKLLADMTPEQIVACIDFRYITDALTPDEALAILRRNEPAAATRARRDGTRRLSRLHHLRRLARLLGRQGAPPLPRGARRGMDALQDQGRPQTSRTTCAAAQIIREEIGPDRKLMMDANQVWDVGEAIANMEHLARFNPWWIEEPTSPDDVLGHAAIARAVAPIGVATGEHCQNRIIFKQLLQANAINVLPDR